MPAVIEFIFRTVRGQTDEGRGLTDVEMKKFFRFFSHFGKSMKQSSLKKLKNHRRK